MIIEGQRRDEYARALAMIGVEHSIPYRVDIDARGFSEEVAAIAGTDRYLGPRAIIVAPEQLSDTATLDDTTKICVAQGNRSGANSTIDGMLRNLRWSDDITTLLKGGSAVLHVSVVGAEDARERYSSIGAPYSVVGEPYAGADAVDSVTAVIGTLDTPRYDARNARRIRETIESLTADVDLLFNKKRMLQLRAEYARAFGIFGNLSAAKTEFTISYDAPIAKMDTAYNDIFIIKGVKAPIVFPRPATASNTPGSHEDAQNKQDRINGHEHNRILDALFSAGLIAYDLTRGSERMDRMEENIMLQVGHFLTTEAITAPQALLSDKDRNTLHATANQLLTRSLKGFERYKMFHRLASDRLINNYSFGYKAKSYLQNLLRNDWSKLKDVLYGKVNPSAVPVDLRVNLIYSVDPADIHTREILARMTPDDYPEQFMYHREGFNDQMRTADDMKRKAIIERMSIFSAETGVDIRLEDGS